MENTVKNNKLLAIFLGWVESGFKRKNIFNPVTREEFKDSELLFHSDWNWLMEVVENILQICAEMDEMERYWCITDVMPYIDNVYTACVEFVNWYNEQK